MTKQIAESASLIRRGLATSLLANNKSEVLRQQNAKLLYRR